MATPMRIKTAAETASADYNIARMLEQADGLEKIALAQLPPFIRETRDYTGFCRKLIVAHNVSSDDMYFIDQEPVVYYPKDLNSRAAFYGDDSQIPRYQIEGDGVNVAIMTVAADDTVIHIKRLMVQKYNYLERVRELSGQAMAKAEDTRFLNLVEALLKGGGDNVHPEFEDQIVKSTATSLTKNDLVDLRKKITQNNIPVASFLMHPARQEDVLKWGFGVNGSDVDQLTQREMIESGVKYAFFGTKIITSIIIPMDVVYCFAEPEYVGRMPIMKDLSVRLTERENKLEKGLFMYEFIGMYLASQKAVAKLVIDYVDGQEIVGFISEKEGAFGREKSIVGDIKGFGSLQGR